MSGKSRVAFYNRGLPQTVINEVVLDYVKNINIEKYEKEDFLNPCPFCGGKEYLYGTKKDDNGINKDIFYIKCGKCECQTKEFTIEGYMGVKRFVDKVINTWNRRYK